MTSLALTVPLTIVTLLGIVINGYVLVIIVLTKQVNTANNILLLHLGFVHILLGILYVTLSASNFTKHDWLEDGAPCILHGFLFTLLHPLALWTICGLNCDRFYAIASPLHYGHIVNSKKVLMGLGASWFISLAVCVPPFFKVAPYQYMKELGACMPDFSDGFGTLWYSACYTAITLLLPATLITCCNLKILTIARYHRHRIASAIYEVTLSAQVTITHQRNPFFVPTITAPSHGGPKVRSYSAISTVLQILVSFALLYFPYYVVTLWNASSSLLEIGSKYSSSRPEVMVFASSLLTCSPFINGFLYGVRNKVLRKTFQNYWRKKLTKNEVNQEIQARTPSTCGSRRPSITPLGFFNKPPLQRRLSDAVIEVHRNPCKSNMKRISSELAWKQNSNKGLDEISDLEKKRPPLVHTASCNTLKVPCVKGDEDEFKIKQRKSEDLVTNLLSHSSLSTANLLLQKVFGLESPNGSSKKFCQMQPVMDATPKKSPKITITRAFSEDSDKTCSIPSSPARETMNKKYSSSGSLLERKWIQLKGKGRDNQKKLECNKNTVKPLLSSMDEGSFSNRSSESSIISDTSSGRVCSAVVESACPWKNEEDGGCEAEPAENQALLDWPKNSKIDYTHRSSLLRNPLVKMQSQEIIL